MPETHKAIGMFHLIVCASCMHPGRTVVVMAQQAAGDTQCKMNASEYAMYACDYAICACDYAIRAGDLSCVTAGH